MKPDIDTEQVYREVLQEIALLRDWLDEALYRQVGSKPARDELHKAIEAYATLARATAVYEYIQGERSKSQ